VDTSVPISTELVAATARRATPRRDEVTAAMVTQFAAEISPLQHDDQLLGLLAASTDENVVAVLHALEHGIDARTLEAPPAAIEYARRLAQRGVPVSALLRAYRLGLAAFVEHMLAEIAAAGADPAVTSAAGITMIRVSHGYVDHVSERVVSAYEAEREAWARHHWTVRAGRITALLEGTLEEVRGAETRLGYRLAGIHVAAFVWLEGRLVDRGEEPVRLERLVTAAATALGTAHLFLPADEAVGRAWFTVPEGMTAAAVGAALLEAGGEATRVTLGNPGLGLGGFRRSNRQAQQTRRVSLAAGAHAARAVSFAEVGVVALLCEDLDAARTWVSDTLGPLADDDENAARLRETARVFLAMGSSHTAAGELLATHKNTVQYRVQKAEQLRGRPFREERSDVEVALAACHVLGPAVLRPTGSTD
jgi:hypothetical protein